MLKQLWTSSNSRGFSHVIFPIIAIIGVAIVGSLLISSSRAATATYSGTCTGTVISTSTKVTTTKYKDCIFQAQELMDAIQREDYKSYHTAIETVPDTFVSGSQHYLTMNSIYSTATAYAVKALPGNGSKNELTNGTSGTWQTLCTDAVGAGLATGGKAANYVLSINTKVTGEYSKYTNANNFKSTCGTTTSGGTSGGSSTPPATRLGFWTSAEDSGGFSTVAGQKPDVANEYLAWNSAWPSQFVNSAEAAGATPFIELEPWNDGSTDPQFSSIDSGQYDSWLTSLGTAVKSLGKPVIFTFAHEFNVSGQYPWAVGDTGSCGSSSCTPAEWIEAWDHVESVVDKAAGGHAFWMWCPNVDSGGSNTNPVNWWPGSSEVQMVGVDGYPSFINSSSGTFQSDFGQTFSEIHTKTKLPIFISETDLSPLGSGGYESIPDYIADLFADGGDGVLIFEDGTPAMSSSQLSQLDTALAKYPK